MNIKYSRKITNLFLQYVHTGHQGFAIYNWNWLKPLIIVIVQCVARYVYSNRYYVVSSCTEESIGNTTNASTA